jgi:prepilin-type N-terminal cleavage/methylation domain-containing protein
MPTEPHTADRRAARGGFTLTELLVVLTIVGVMAAMSVPSFQRAVEQSRADIAVANLRAIWAAERLYWLEYHTYTSNIGTLQDLGVLDSGIPNNASASMGGYQYSISAPSPDTAMTATATHAGGMGAYSINESGNVSGSISVGSIAITPGFQ